jgi:hypothetical protein
MAEIFEKPPETGGRYEPLGAAELLDHDDRSLRLRAGSTTVEVTALAPDLFRVGAFPEGRPPGYDSEAIAKKDWDRVDASIESSDNVLMLSTPQATARVSLDPLRISFTDPSGRAFAADDEELGSSSGEKTTSSRNPLARRHACTRGARRESGTSVVGSVPAGSRRQARTRFSGTSIRRSATPPPTTTSTPRSPSPSRWLTVWPTASSSTTPTASSST